MSSFQIKLIAVITMVVDHVGLFFFPEIEFMRIIGRIAFPLFAWLIAEGAFHTRDIRLYAARLFALAVVSQVPFALANGIIDAPLGYLNVVFTLVLGLFAIMIMRMTNNKLLWVVGACALALTANFVHADYGAAGVLSIAAFYAFRNRFAWLIAVQILLIGILPSAMPFIEFFLAKDLSWWYFSSRIEWYGLVALLCIYLYNGTEGLKAKYLFYIFYPLQYVAIYLGQLFLR